jgi:hypothetical protein
MKYTLTTSTKVHNGLTLYRIQCITPFNDVEAGELGGWIEKYGNLSQLGNCWVGDNAMVFNNGLVSDDARVGGHSLVFDNGWVSGSASITDHVMVYESARISGEARLNDFTKVGGNGQVLDIKPVLEETGDYIKINAAYFIALGTVSLLEAISIRETILNSQKDFILKKKIIRFLTQEGIDEASAEEFIEGKGFDSLLNYFDPV